MIATQLESNSRRPTRLHKQRWRSGRRRRRLRRRSRRGLPPTCGSCAWKLPPNRRDCAIVHHQICCSMPLCKARELGRTLCWMLPSVVRDCRRHNVQCRKQRGVSESNFNLELAVNWMDDGNVPTPTEPIERSVAGVGRGLEEQDPGGTGGAAAHQARSGGAAVRMLHRGMPDISTSVECSFCPAGPWSNVCSITLHLGAPFFDCLMQQTAFIALQGELRPGVQRL